MSGRRWFPWCSFCWQMCRKVGVSRRNSFLIAMGRHGARP